MLNPRTQQAIYAAIGQRRDGPLLRNEWQRRMQPHNAAAIMMDFPPERGHRGYAARVDGSSRLTAWWCSHSSGGMWPIVECSRDAL